MTDKEIRRIKDGVISIFEKFNILDHAATIDSLRDDILRLIGSMQERPGLKFNVGDKVRNDRIAGLPICTIESIDDTTYYCDYTNFDIIVQDKWELVVEPKECMYSKDNYTDEDRKVLCDGCEEECKMGIKSKHATGKLKECIDNITEESLTKARKQLQEESQVCMYSTANYTDEDRKALCDGCEEECKFNKKEEPVSEDLEEAVNAYIGYTPEVDESSSTYGKRQAFKAGANWHEQKDESYTKSMYKVGINTGKELMKQQMMAKAVDGLVVCNNLTHGYKDILMEIPSYLNVDDEVKVIVIKKD